MAGSTRSRRYNVKLNVQVDTELGDECNVDFDVGIDVLKYTALIINSVYELAFRLRCPWFIINSAHY